MGDLVYGSNLVHPDGSETYLPELTDGYGSATFSPDGSSLAFAAKLDGNNSELKLLSSSGRVRTIVTLPGFFRITGLTWSPDGSALAMVAGDPAVGGYDSTLYRVDVASGALSILVRSAEFRVSQGRPSWSPRGDRIAFASAVMDTAERSGYTRLATVPAGGGAASVFAIDLSSCPDPVYCGWQTGSPTWAPDGSALYTIGKQKGVGHAAREAQNLLRFQSGNGDPKVLATVPWTSEKSLYWAQPSTTPLVSLDGNEIVLPLIHYENGNNYPGVFLLHGGKLTPIEAHYPGPSDWQPCPTGKCVRWQGAEPPDSECSDPSRDPVYCYAPAVHLHPDEVTFPMDVTTFARNSRLMWNRDHGCKDEIVASKVDVARLGHRASNPYRAKEAGAFPRCKASGKSYASDDLTKPGAADKPSGLDKEEGFYLDLNDSKRLGSKPVGGQVRVGAYYSRSPDGRAITYWFMYGFNQGAPGAGSRVDRHEGEWERVTVDLNDDNTARQMRFWQHECANPETVPYSDVLVDETGHPIVYAALGSHASFPNVRPPVGRGGLCPLNGQQVIGQGWGDRTAPSGAVWRTWETSLKNAAAQPWYGFGGAWGEIGGYEKVGGLATPCSDKDDILGASRKCLISATGPLGPPHKNLFAYP